MTSHSTEAEQACAHDACFSHLHLQLPLPPSRNIQLTSTPNAVLLAGIWLMSQAVPIK